MHLQLDQFVLNLYSSCIVRACLYFIIKLELFWVNYFSYRLTIFDPHWCAEALLQMVSIIYCKLKGAALGRYAPNGSHKEVLLD